MRFVPSYCLRAGMVLGRDLYGRSNELLLSRGQVLTETEISRIMKLGYQGIYADDGFSEEPEIGHAISAQLKNNAVASLKEAFRLVQTEKDSPQVLRQIETAVCEIVDEIIDNRDAVINMIDLKIYDEYTYFHSINVAVLSTILGYAMGCKRNELYKLALGSALHDIGKVFISKDILEKPGELSDSEMESIREHSFLGSRYLKEKWDIPAEANFPVLTHHERFDGTGYPGGIKGHDIPKFGRIAAVADVYDALTSDRPYRKAVLPSEAVEHIMGGSGNLYDPDMVGVFLKEISPYPVGTCVLLSNGLKGVVVDTGSKCGTRPKIKIDTAGDTPVFYDLYNDMNLLNVTIKEITYF